MLASVLVCEHPRSFLTYCLNPNLMSWRWFVFVFVSCIYVFEGGRAMKWSFSMQLNVWEVDQRRSILNKIYVCDIYIYTHTHTHTHTRLCIYLFICVCIYIGIYIVISLYPRMPHSQIWRIKYETWASVDFGTPEPVPHGYKGQPYEAGFLDLGIINLFIDKSLLLCPACQNNEGTMSHSETSHSTTVCRPHCLCKALLLQLSPLFSAGLFPSMYTNTVFYIKNKIYAQDMCILI